MASEGDKATVVRATKVRTKLKGDMSWLQGRTQTEETKNEEEKPWLAEVRARRLNGEPTSPVSVKPTPAPKPTIEQEKPASSGYLIRGVLTKTDKPATQTTTNGVSSTSTPFSKKPSETYKLIAPHTVRPTPESTAEFKMSTDEKDKRTEAASSVLKKSSVRQRSYVLSAAKKYESQEKIAVPSPTSTFVAKRVNVEDSETAPPVAPVQPLPKVRKTSGTSVQAVVVAPVSAAVKADEPPVKDTEPELSASAAKLPEKDPFEGMKPGCTKVATPLPALLPEDICTDDSVFVAQFAPVSPATEPTSPTAGSPEPPGTVTKSTSVTDRIAKFEQLLDLNPEPESEQEPEKVSLPVPEPKPEPVCQLKPPPQPEPEPEPEPALKPELKPELKLEPEPEPEPEPELLKQEPASNPSSTVDTLTDLSNTLVSFNTSSTRAEPEVEMEQESPVKTQELIVEQDPTPALSNSEPIIEDLLALDDGPVEPVPPSPGHWSEDLLGNLDSESNPVKTNGSLDLLAGDLIPINTDARSLSTPQREEGKQTDETAKETQSSTKTATITTETLIITDRSEEDNADPWSSTVTTTVTQSSSADLFDPYPIGTTSQNSSSDLLQPLADISINSPSPTFEEEKSPTPEIKMSSNALESLADDVIPIDTDTTRISSTRSWSRSWETSPGDAEESSQSTVMEEKSPEIKMSSNALESLADDVIPIDTDTTRISTTRTWTKSWDDPQESSQSTVEEGKSPEIKMSSNALESLADDVIPIDTDTTRISSTRSWSRSWDEPQESSQSTVMEEKSPEIKMSSNALESLADDVIPIDTDTTRISTTRSWTRSWDDPQESSQSTEVEEKSPEIKMSSNALESLADDVIPIDTDTTRISTRTWSRSWDEPQESSQSTVVEEKSPEIKMSSNALESLADDVIPIDTDTTRISSTRSWSRSWETSPSQVDDSQESRMSSNALESLADDVIPIDTDTTRISSSRSWARSWEPSPSEPADSQPRHQSPEVEDQQTVIMFERKSKEYDSPWDRWTSPTVYTVDKDEEEEEPRREYSQTETVTTITTIRETHSEAEPAMDRYETRTVMEEDRRVPSPEPESKKGFVYVKQYVDASEVSLQNARHSSDSDYLTSRSTSYSYSSPSSNSLSSTCTYCGQQVGNDAKITIEHLNINCHPHCFKCAVCGKPMGDLLFSMFLHGGKVHCESCYAAALD